MRQCRGEEGRRDLQLKNTIINYDMLFLYNIILHNLGNGRYWIFEGEIFVNLVAL